MTAVPKLYSAELDGVGAELIEVEAYLNVGLHSFQYCRPCRQSPNGGEGAVNSALKNSGIKPPSKENRRITVNLAPADVKKIGSRFDLPIALAYLFGERTTNKFGTKRQDVYR